jgi:hypothetical protein
MEGGQLVWHADELVAPRLHVVLPNVILIFLNMDEKYYVVTIPDVQEEQELKEVPPWLVRYVPSGHNVHVDWPVFDAYDPVGQGVQQEP